MRRILFCLFSVFLHSNGGIPKDREIPLQFGTRSSEDFISFLRAKRVLSSINVIPHELLSRRIDTRKNAINEIHKNKDFFMYSNKKINNNNFHVNMYGGDGHYRKQTKNSGIRKIERSVNHENQESVVKHRSKRSPTRTQNKNGTFHALQEETTQINFEDLKAKILASLSYFEEDVIKRPRRQSNRIKAIINDPELGPPEPFVTFAPTPLPGCCTSLPPPPPETPEYFNMTGDHMNIYPEAPEWGYPEIDRAVPTMRNWWYYNQDDYQQLKPKIPKHVMTS